MRWSPVILICSGLFAAFGCSSANRSPETPQEPPSQPKPESEVPDTEPIAKLAPGEPPSAIPVEADDGRLGAKQAPVTIVAFLDYECAFCARGFETLMQLRDRYSPKEVRIVFKHVPLDIHPKALPAAVAGQAVQLAAGSEAFFQFSSLAFEGQAVLDYVKLAEWAKQVGVSQELYNELVTKEETVRRVARDVMLAQSVGVDGTPAFFVNGRALPGMQSMETFERVIERELQAMEDVSKDNWKEAYQKRLEENMSVTLVEALLARDPHDYRVPVNGSPVWGPEDAPVTMVVFTDFECPFCKRAHPTIKRLKEEFSDSLRIVFKHLPLSFHENARPAARLSIQIRKARGEKAFFSAVDDLFEGSPELSREQLEAIGKQYGLKDEEIQEALNGSPDLEKRILRDETLAEDVLARGTPHFFINGKRMTGARPVEHFEAMIQHEKKRAQKLIAQGVDPKDAYETLQKDAQQPGAPQKVTHDVPTEGRPSLGPRDAPVVIHVFSDFQCPFCRKAESVLEELRERYPRKLRFVWHDFPLPFHEHALPAALAAREAYRQGGDEMFWRMHDALFSLEGDAAAISREQILEHTKHLGLDVEKMKQALAASELPPTLEKDKQLAKELGIEGTPVFVVGNYLIAGARPIEHFERVLDLLFAKNTAQKN